MWPPLWLSWLHLWPLCRDMFVFGFQVPHAGLLGFGLVWGLSCLVGRRKLAKQLAVVCFMSLALTLVRWFCNIMWPALASTILAIAAGVSTLAHSLTVVAAIGLP